MEKETEHASTYGNYKAYNAHMIISADTAGLNDEHAVRAQQWLGTNIMGAITMILFVGVPISALGFACLWGEFRKCTETKKETEKRLRKERRSAERREKYLAAREAQRKKK